MVCVNGLRTSISCSSLRLWLASGLSFLAWKMGNAAMPYFSPSFSFRLRTMSVSSLTFASCSIFFFDKLSVALHSFSRAISLSFFRSFFSAASVAFFLSRSATVPSSFSISALSFLISLSLFPLSVMAPARWPSRWMSSSCSWICAFSAVISLSFLVICARMVVSSPSDFWTLASRFAISSFFIVIISRTLVWCSKEPWTWRSSLSFSMSASFICSFWSWRGLTSCPCIVDQIRSN